MSEKNIYIDQNLNQNCLKNGKWELLAADPVAPFEGQEWCNTTDMVRRVYKNGIVETYATQDWVTLQVNQIERAQSGFDANPGLLPVLADKTTGDLTAFVIGDYWVINNAGTIVGITGDDVLANGDKLEYLGGDPTLATSWLGIQRNIDDTLLGNTRTERQTVSLVASTGLTVTAASIADIHSIQVYDSAGVMIEVCIEKTANPNQRVLTSNSSLAGVVVEMTGASS